MFQIIHTEFTVLPWRYKQVFVERREMTSELMVLQFKMSFNHLNGTR